MVTIGEAIDRLFAVGDSLTNWERDFLHGVTRHAKRFGGLTDKQLAVLERLYVAYCGSIPLDAALPGVSDELQQLARAREQLANRDDKAGLN